MHEEGRPFVSRRDGTTLTFENVSGKPLSRIAYDFRRVDIGESLASGETVTVRDEIFNSYVTHDGAKHLFCDHGRSLKTKAWAISGSLIYERVFTCDEIAAMGYRISIGTTLP